jgi:hypothetical protein
MESHNTRWLIRNLFISITLVRAAIYMPQICRMKPAPINNAIAMIET